jgi:hypothetical protein
MTRQGSKSETLDATTTMKGKSWLRGPICSPVHEHSIGIAS